ncbi:MAG: hypothetical protein RIT22_2199 [Bacteroidota bacterium]
MTTSRLFRDFFESEKAGGMLLLLVTIISLVLANSPIQTSYIGFWETEIGHHSITHWINDGLMTVFFLLIGLELERELYGGELSTIKNAALPIFGALGGMLIPAGVFLAFNWGTSTQNGAGIPMATDIAFAIGILSLLGNRVPNSLKIFLTALAVIDDLGAILVIAIFYTETISFLYLGLALGIMGLLFILNRKNVHNLIPYLIGGGLMWYCMLHSGVHYYRRAAGLCHSIWQWREKHFILPIATLFAPPSSFFYSPFVCYREYWNCHRCQLARRISSRQLYRNYGRIDSGKTHWNHSFCFTLRQTRHWIAT